MNVVRSLIYTLVFFIGSIPIVLGAVLFALIGPKAVLIMPRTWARYHYWCLRWILRTEVRVEGVLPQHGAIVALKHESFCETYEVLRLFDAPAVVFKAELIRIPFWGRAALAHGVIPVARETGATALRRMLKAAREAVAAGRPVIIFPEGTRIRHGERPSLRPGVAGLYKALNLPVVPVAVDTGKLWAFKGFLKRPGTITFRVGETIPVGLPREVVESRIHTAINALND